MSLTFLIALPWHIPSCNSISSLFQIGIKKASEKQGDFSDVIAEEITGPEIERNTDKDSHQTRVDSPP